MGLAANYDVELSLGLRKLKSRVLRRLGPEIYLEALMDVQSELTPPPGSNISISWVEDDARWMQAGEILDVLDPLQILMVKLKGTPSLREQRVHPRVKVGVPLEYGLPRDSEMFLTTTLDLSMVGLRFPSVFQVWHGLNLRLRLRLGQQSVSLWGEVIRFGSQAREFRGRLQWEVVVRFINVNPAARRALNQFIVHRLDRSRERKGVNV